MQAEAWPRTQLTVCHLNNMHASTSQCMCDSCPEKSSCVNVMGTVLTPLIALSSDQDGKNHALHSHYV